MPYCKWMRMLRNTEQNEALYDIDSDEQARMHTLLQRAMNNEHQTAMPDEQRVTRSSG